MKLHDFLANSGNRSYFRANQLERFEGNLYMCEKHEVDLLVRDGYKLEYCDISYDSICFEASDENPNAIWFYESWNVLDIGESVPTKLAFCEICDKEFNEYVDKYFASQKKKKIKGKKSKKYKQSD